MNSVSEAQRDMRLAYGNGVPGIVSSGSIWLAAGIVAAVISPVAGIITLVFGGMLIFPVSVLLCKVVGLTGKHSPANPLAPLAIEGTIWMLLCIPIAGGAALHKIEWFFPAMMLVIAGRYLTFATLYGLRIYWAFAVALAVAGFALLAINAPVFIGGLAGGLVEIVFALATFKLYGKAKSEVVSELNC